MIRFLKDVMSFNSSDLYQETLTLFRMGGGGKKAPPTSFSPVTSTNVRISPQNFLTFSLLPHWCKISSLYQVPVPNYRT